MSFGSFGSSQNQGFGGGGFGSGGSSFGSSFGNSNTGGFGGSSNSFGGSSGFGGGIGGTGLQNGNGDFEIPKDNNSPTDAISCMAWTPQMNMNMLVVGSWDGKVRCYEVNDNGSQLNVQMRAFTQHQAPVLDVCFKEDGSGCFSAGCDNMAKMWNFENGPPGGQQNAQDVGKHDAPIRSVRWIAQNRLLATGGWDNKINYWDLRQPNPVLSVQLPGRVDCMDINFPYCVVGTGGTENDRQVLIYNLQANPQQPERILNETPQPNNSNTARAKPLKRQYRTCEIFPDVSGYAIASIEGRCSIQYFGLNNTSNNFAFKCHRDKNSKRIYAVNSVTFHKHFGTFATAGADGMWNFWDKDSKQRLKASSPITMDKNEPAPITCSAFNGNGNLYAYAISYDWSKGFSGCPPSNPVSIYIHRTQEAEVRPKRGTSSSKRY